MNLGTNTLLCMSHLCRGGSAEHVGSQLDLKLRDALRARSNLFNEGLGGVAGLNASSHHHRPLLCLFDRNFDLSAAIQQVRLGK